MPRNTANRWQWPTERRSDSDRAHTDQVAQRPNIPSEVEVSKQPNVLTSIDAPVVFDEGFPAVSGSGERQIGSDFGPDRLLQIVDVNSADWIAKDARAWPVRESTSSAESRVSPYRGSNDIRPWAPRDVRDEPSQLRPAVPTAEPPTSDERPHRAVPATDQFSLSAGRDRAVMIGSSFDKRLVRKRGQNRASPRAASPTNRTGPPLALGDDVDLTRVRHDAVRCAVVDHIPVHDKPLRRPESGIG